MPQQLALPARPKPSVPQEYQAKFLKQITSEQNRISKKPPAISGAAHRKRLQNVRFFKPKYADATKMNVCGICLKWMRYCDRDWSGQWKQTLETLKREISMDFLLYVCEQSRIDSWGTSKVYIRQFQQLYTSVTGRYMDRNDAKELYKYHDLVLVPRFGLRAPNIDGKPVVGVAALRVLLTFNLGFDTCIVPCEGQRVQRHGIYQLLSYTGVRPAELVDNTRKKPKGGCFEQLFGQKAVESPDASGAGNAGADAEALDSGYCSETEDNINSTGRHKTADPTSRDLDDLLSQETVGRDRPKALCYEDILLMIVRHPVTGLAIPAMAIKFIHHKGEDNKPKPTIFHFTPTRKVIFCAVTTMIALALRDDAFDADGLVNATRVMNLKPTRFTECIPLRWKKSKLKTPVFRHYNRNGVLDDEEAMRYYTLKDGMAQQSLDAGNEKHFTPRWSRRGTANAANGEQADHRWPKHSPIRGTNRILLGNAPDPVRDQMMRHDPRFTTFFNAYLNEIVQFDMQNTFLEEETEDELFRMFAHVSLTRDPRATRDMVPDEVWRNLPPDPEIVELEKRRAALKDGRYRIAGLAIEEEVRQLTQQIRTLRDKRDKMVAKNYREFYFYHSPTWAIERQIRGEAAEDEGVQLDYDRPSMDLAIPERARLGEILCNQPTDLTDDEVFQLRIEAIDLFVSLFGKRETAKRKQIRRRLREAESVVKDEEKAVREKCSPFPLLMDIKQCPDCFGDGTLSREEREFRYCRPTVRNDHFDDAHLPERERAERNGELQVCHHENCRDMKFQGINHFRNHVQTVHGIALRTEEQVDHRRTRRAARRRS